MNSVITHQVELLYAKSNRLIDLIENKSMFGIFGTGKLAQDCYAKIKEMGHTASFFVDRNEEDGIFMNLPLKTIKYISQKNIAALENSCYLGSGAGCTRLCRCKAHLHAVVFV